jgi:hypothetical protein
MVNPMMNGGKKTIHYISFFPRHPLSSFFPLKPHQIFSAGIRGSCITRKKCNPCVQLVLERMPSGKNAWIFLTSTGTIVKSRIFMQTLIIGFLFPQQFPEKNLYPGSLFLSATVRQQLDDPGQFPTVQGMKRAGRFFTAA